MGLNSQKQSLPLYKKSHTWHTSEFSCHSLMNFEKPEKSDFLKKEKNCWRYNHFTHVYVYQKTQSYEVQLLRYRVRQNFLSFWAIFCPFVPLTVQKVKISKKRKKHLEISSFYTSVPKFMIICFTVPEIMRVTDAIIFHFGIFFALLPSDSPKNQNLKKKEKNAWRYHHFTQVYQKL